MTVISTYELTDVPSDNILGLSTAVPEQITDNVK